MQPVCKELELFFAQSEDCALSSSMVDGAAQPVATARIILAQSKDKQRHGGWYMQPAERESLRPLCKVPSSCSGHFQPSDEIDCGHPS